MAGSATLFGHMLLSMASGDIDFTSDDFKVMLCTSSFTPNKDTMTTASQVTNEVVGTGYTAGGTSLQGVNASYDSTNHELVVDADDTEWTDSSVTARYAVINDTTANLLIGYVDFGVDKTSDNGPFKITWDPTGVIVITLA